MKLILSALLVLVQLTAFGAASVPYEQLNPHHFDWAVFPEVSLKGMSRAADLPGDIISLVGGTNYWKLSGNDLSPTVGTSVSTTNLFAYSTLNAAGALVLTGTLTTNMVAGTNDVSSLGYDVIRVTGFNASTNGSFLRLYAPGNGLGTILVVQNYSAGSGFTMANNSECAGGDPTMIMRLNGDWTPNRQGESIMLYNYGQGWAEIGRTPTQSITYSTAIFTNVFTTSFVLGGTYITNVVQGVNPTLLHVPYKNGTNSFGDSPFIFESINRIGFNATNISGPVSYLVGDYTNSNNALGYGAFNNLDLDPISSSAFGNNAFGSQAGGELIEGGNNVAIGDLAMLGATNTSNNTIVGTAAGSGSGGATHGAMGRDSLFGVQAGYALTTGTDNTYAGFNAGQLGTTGSKNVAIGALALQQGSGSERIAIGYNALNAGGGTDSVAIGKDSAKTSTGINTTLGTSSGLGLTTGAANTLIGLAAGQGIINGNQNSWLGEYAPDNAGFNAQRSVVAGYRATVGDALTNLVTSILIGNYGASGSFTTAALTNVIGIGNEVRVTNNNEIVIGNSTNTKVIFPITSYTGTGANFLSDDGTYKTAGGGPGGATLWYGYTSVDSEGGPSQITASTNSFFTNAVRFSVSYITNFWNDYSVNFSVGHHAQDPDLLTQNGNVNCYNFGDYTDGQSLTNCYAMVNFLGSNGNAMSNCFHMYFYGDTANVSATNCNYFTSLSPANLTGAAINDSSEFLTMGRYALKQAIVSNGFDIISIGSQANLGLTGTGLNHIFVAGSNVTATNSNEWIAGDTVYNYKFPGASFTAASVVTAQSGFKSQATDAAVAITATGITNALGKNAMAYFDGTTLTFTLKTAANSPFYTNTVSVGHAEVMLQNGEALMITAGSGTGVLKAF